MFPESHSNDWNFLLNKFLWIIFPIRHQTSLTIYFPKLCKRAKITILSAGSLFPSGKQISIVFHPLYQPHYTDVIRYPIQDIYLHSFMHVLYRSLIIYRVYMLINSNLDFTKYSTFFSFSPLPPLKKKSLPFFHIDWGYTIILPQ